MIKWKDILKSSQINIGSTTLDMRNLPEEDDDKGCCEEAHAAWINLSKDVLEEYEKGKKATKNSIDFWSRMAETFPEDYACKHPEDFFRFLLYQLDISKDYYDKPGLYSNTSNLPNFYVPRLRKILNDWEKCDPEIWGEAGKFYFVANM